MKKEKQKVPCGKYFVGDKISVEKYGYLKIMAFTEHYVMLRYKGFMPFIEHIDKFNKRFEGEKF